MATPAYSPAMNFAGPAHPAFSAFAAVAVVALSPFSAFAQDAKKTSAEIEREAELRIAGPELTDVLESLVNPSAFVVPGYGITLITLKDGTSIGATLLEESGTELTLKNPDGSVQKVAVADIASRQPPMSAMPPMIAFLSKREIRDLVAYLTKQKGKPSTGH